MERLWSPWRMEYIQANKDQPDADEGCVFCGLLDGTGEGERILARSELAFVTLAKYPYNPGHLLVLPTRHVGELEDLTAEEHAAIDALLARGIRALRTAADPHGFNVGLNLGRVAGAGIPAHLHWHVVPRWGGDTNFMPVVGQTRVLPELLAESDAKLRPLFEAEES
ncbi:MAG TPA: HIT domain-containing protein [Actinomycetota bacterium]